MKPVAGGEFDDPEKSYRRGYQQGAHHALEAASKLRDSDSSGWVKLRDWVGILIHRWRYQTPSADRGTPPPPPPN